MPATAHRLNITVTAGRNPSVRMDYQVREAADEAEALLALEGVISATYVDLKLHEYGVGEAQGNGVWPAFASYARGSVLRSNQPKGAEPPEVGETVITYETSVGTERMYRSYATMSTVYVAGESSGIVASGSLNASADSVEGIDVDRPNGGFEVTMGLSAAVCTASYRQNCQSLVGRVNNAAFNGYAAGEVKCTRVRFTQRNGGDWTAEFGFAVSRNVTATAIGALPSVTKEGWWYLNYHFEQRKTSDKIYMKALGATVEVVYQYGDFSAFGL